MRERNSLGRLVDDSTPRKKLLAANRSSKSPGRINLRAVSEVLESRGIDPADAILKILAPEDPEGNPLPCRLPPEVEARIWNEMLQYTQPKLKSVEIKGRVGVAAFDPSDEQARAMAEEFLAAQTVAPV